MPSLPVGATVLLEAQRRKESVLPFVYKSLWQFGNGLPGSSGRKRHLRLPGYLLWQIVLDFVQRIHRALLKNDPHAATCFSFLRLHVGKHLQHIAQGHGVRRFKNELRTLDWNQAPKIVSNDDTGPKKRRSFFRSLFFFNDRPRRDCGQGRAKSSSVAMSLVIVIARRRIGNGLGIECVDHVIRRDNSRWHRGALFVPRFPSE